MTAARPHVDVVVNNVAGTQDGDGGWFDVLWSMPSFTRSLDALCRRQPELRAKIWRVLDRYLSDTRALHRSPLHNSRRTVHHTRVDDEKRVIDEPLGPQRPREVAILYVGHHDEANRWGAKYADDTLAKLHIATPRGGAWVVHEESEPSDVYSAEGRGTWFEQGLRTATYGDLLTRKDLKRLSVPSELWAQVLKAPDTVELATLGVEPSIVERVYTLYLLRAPSKPFPVPVPGVEEPRPIPITREELPSLLRIPLGKFLATMTEEQKRLARRDADGLMVVKGAAGSGKTVIGVRRIEFWLEQRDLFDKRPILFTCYNKVLAHAARQMLEDTIGRDLKAAGVEVKTAYKVMSELRDELEGDRAVKLVSTKRLAGVIGDAREKVKERALLERWSNVEILDEILEIIYARVLTTSEMYLVADRSGRGTGRGLDRARRLALWKVYRGFRQLCDEQRIAPWDQLPARLASLLERKPVTSPRYAAIVVDEAQDLPASIFRVLLALQAGQERNILVLGDAAQNVYRNSFRWMHTGLRVTGRVTTLRRSFRSTPNIIGAATPLIKRQAQRFEDDLVLPEASGDDPGPPVSITLHESRAKELDAVAESIGVLVERGVPPASIGVLLDRSADRRALAERLQVVLELRVEDYIKPGNVKSIDIFDQSVKLLSAASSKGIEFQVLFIPFVTEEGFPSDDEDGESSDRARRSLYTAMARCAYDLRISARRGQESGLLRELDSTCCRHVVS